MVDKGGRTSFRLSAISPDRVGWKAYGLSCLPAEWVPAYFVITARAAKKSRVALQVAIEATAAELQFANEDVLVRSSGIGETIEQRGRLASRTCSVADAAAAVSQLRAELAPSERGRVHWIIQRNIRGIRKGHLSNERRMSREPRDFLAEIQAENDRAGYTAPVSVRHWRDDVSGRIFDLRCNSEAAITLTLKKVALWGAGLDCRVLFEWVWSGSALWIVQADIARPAAGVEPPRLLPRDVFKFEPEVLAVFRVATPADYVTYPKLSNARTYGEIGYAMPQFYVLDDAATMQRLRNGVIDQALARDLRELTRRPLIIRTDGINVATDKREMLPRSDTLASPEDARKWLRKSFAPRLNEIDHDAARFCLLAHHFIPSVASAWARADVGRSMVRVESLWGVPEGLYWHSHDTYEIDTKDNVRMSDFTSHERIRYKGTFIAPDASGKWVYYQAAPPYDWRSSITKRQRQEIARGTRLIAEHDRKAVAVMWFVGNHPAAAPHDVLPWYHSASEIGTPKAAPERKFKGTSDIRVETMHDWNALRRRVEAGERVERLILEPKTDEWIRNPELAKDVGTFCASNRIVIEMYGAILSHAYHALRRTNAQVECVDLFGADEEKVEYNKLVRDGIPKAIKSRGEDYEAIYLRGDALEAALRQKLVEEAYEALDAKSGTELVGELGDVLEVIAGLCAALDIPLNDVASEQSQKRKKRGGFSAGVMLRTTLTPQSLAGRASEIIQSSLPVVLEAAIPYVSQIPVTPDYVRPDLRTVEGEPEPIFTFETEINRKIRGERKSTVFEIPIGDGGTRYLTVVVEVTRSSAVLRLQIRLRFEPAQLKLQW